jgi:hypothetical protein
LSIKFWQCVLLFLECISKLASLADRLEVTDKSNQWTKNIFTVIAK